jgi:sigma-B regulation protein RsbU (phosphoserine phosphatase)
MRILLAEDDLATQLMIRSLLTRWGHEVITAGDGEEAWRRWQAERPQLILCDWEMPNLNGLELVRRIRAAADDDPRYTYIIMLTARSDTNDLVTVLDAGANDFVGKPFARAELRARLEAGARIVALESELAEKNASLLQANRHMHYELQAAARIQSSFLPSRLPEFEGVKFAWHYEPCEELSGDTLNILPFDAHRVGLYIVDVCGHGVTAALLSVHVSRLFTQVDSPDSILRHEGQAIEAPAAVAAHLNRLFSIEPGRDDLQYFTLLYGILDTKARRFDFTSAGHPGPIVVRARDAQAIELLEAEPPAVGFFPEAEFAEQSVTLEMGDRLYLYTDGLFESIRPAEDRGRS